MYRKTMTEALREAREYRDPINEGKLPRQLKDKNKETMVSKDGKVIVIDKSDWPTYKAKGWGLAEENILDEEKLTYDEWLKQVKGIEKGAHGIKGDEHAKYSKEWRAYKTEAVEEAKTVGGALAQGHLETMTDQRFKEFYGITKAEYIEKHGDPRKEEVKEDFKAGDKVKYVGDNPRYKDKTGTISHIATGKGPYNHLVTGIIKGAIAVDPKDLVKEEVELELDESLQLSKVKAYTRSNDHFGARIYIAQQMRDKDMESIYQGLETMHRKYGNTVGNNAILFRDKIERLLYGKIVGKWGTKAGNIIIKEL